MRFNKQIAVILVLSSLLISAIGAALFLYYENENTKKENAQQLAVYIAKKDIKKDALVKESDVVKTVIAKRYLLTKPLLKKEIVNKFAKSAIYKNEMFRKEKLSNKIGDVDAKILPFTHNSYNIAFKRFENPNYSLLKGDIVNIVSVYPKSKAKDNMNYSVRYVAKQVNVIGFLEEGKVVNKAFRKVKKRVKSKNKKQKTPKYELVKVFDAEHDAYNSILLKAVADRLAEASAEYLHEKIRREYWGFAKDESLDNEALIREQYQGIRPAPGYPACPEHTEKGLLWKLLNVEENIGMELTSSFAMWPGAAVSGWYFAHPDAKYFAVAKLAEDQVIDYANRKEMTLPQAERWLAANLDYEPG